MRQVLFPKPINKSLSYGGTLRQKRNGRGTRPLSSREPLHLVLKVNKEKVSRGLRTPKRFLLIHQILEKYALKFFVKVEQISVQGDHIHINLRATRRSNYQSFFRVLAGQIAQQFEKAGLLTAVTDTPGRGKKTGRGLWRYRPFTIDRRDRYPGGMVEGLNLSGLRAELFQGAVINFYICPDEAYG